MRRLFWLAVFLLCAWPRPAWAKEASSVLRVVSWNVWGVPFVSDAREQRMRAIGPAIAKLRPNVVLLQELWSEGDAEVVIQALADAGLAYEIHGASARFAAFGSSGLLIAADRPLRGVSRLDYELGRWPHTPYHLDWLSRKAALAATIDTPGGPLLLVNTHWQAAYRTGNYAPVRLAQSLELCEWLTERETSHLLLAGDFNQEPGEHATDLLGARLGAGELAGGEGLDRIFAVGIRLEHAREALTEDVALTDGRRMPLSDHPAWVADVQLVSRRVENRSAVEADSLRELAAETRTLRRQLWTARILALLGALCCFRLLLGGRVRGLGGPWIARRGRAVRRVLLVVTLSGTAYAAYFAWGYAPSQARGLNHALERLRR
ncbi:MAG: endonuclease/exonuclease/phosphatase family protein [Myxococcales bacterium]|nr:endonuclease/exonuclease/phosphatase family protein [Myxococcales bacterium]